MSLGSWIVAFVLLSAFLLLLSRKTFSIASRIFRRVLKWTVLTEYDGKVESRAIAPARVEDEWLHSTQITDPVSVPWLGTEPPVLIRRNVPATPYLSIRLENGSALMHECYAGEYGSWADGARVRVDVYAIGGWRIYVSEPKLLA